MPAFYPCQSLSTHHDSRVRPRVRSAREAIATSGMRGCGSVGLDRDARVRQRQDRPGSAVEGREDRPRGEQFPCDFYPAILPDAEAYKPTSLGDKPSVSRPERYSKISSRLTAASRRSLLSA